MKNKKSKLKLQTEGKEIKRKYETFYGIIVFLSVFILIYLTLTTKTVILAIIFLVLLIIVVVYCYIKNSENLINNSIDIQFSFSKIFDKFYS